MALLVLALWALTIAIGVYLLVTSTRPALPGDAAPSEQSEGQGTSVAGAPAVVSASGEAVPREAVLPSASPRSALAGPAPAQSGAAGSAIKAVKSRRDMFDPPSLARAKREPIPGFRAHAEFTHPALAITGFAFWLGYTLVRSRLLAAIALGILIGAIAAGVSWAIVNTRAARRDEPDRMALLLAPRVLLLHVVGAAVTILLATLIATRAVLSAISSLASAGHDLTMTILRSGIGQQLGEG